METYRTAHRRRYDLITITIAVCYCQLSYRPKCREEKLEKSEQNVFQLVNICLRLLELMSCWLFEFVVRMCLQHIYRGQFNVVSSMNVDLTTARDIHITCNCVWEVGCKLMSVGYIDTNTTTVPWWTRSSGCFHLGIIDVKSAHVSRGFLTCLRSLCPYCARPI